MCALVALLGLAGNAGAATRSGGTGTDPWVATELPDYSPGDTVSLIGGSWQPGESVHVDVNDDAGQTWSRGVDLTADTNGDIGDSFTLPDWFVATYSVTATGATSGMATSSFTDGNVRARVAGGPTNASISWEKFNGNTSCSGSPNSTGSGTVGTVITGLGIPSGVDAGQSARLTAPALTGFTFSGWSGASSSSTTTVCVPGSNANQIDMVATYAPGMNTTTVAQSKTVTYGDASVTLTATVTPASGPAVNSGTVSFTVNGTSVTSGTVSGGSASASLSLGGVQAGSYAIAATYNAGSGFNGSNNSGQTPAPTLTIGKAGSSTTVTCAAGPFVYNGSAKTPCSATVTGAGGLNQSLGVSYSDNVHAGTATASASYAGDANHNPSSDSETFTIDRADSTTTLICAAGPFVYNGSAQTPCSASVTGAGGLNQSLTVSYGNNISAGTATASATFAGDADHTGSSDSTSFTIDKAGSTTTVSCPAGPFVYNGSAQTPCSANVTGAGGLEQSLTVDYADNLHAGTATASASFAGDANHTGSSDSTSFTIDKREVTASITAADKTYDGSDEAEITGCSLESATDSHGVVSPDAVDCTASNGHFADANAGNGKAVNADVVLTGTAKDDYQLTVGAASTTADIDKADLDISAVSESKTYDGTTSSSGIPTVSGLQGSDTVTGKSQAFQSKNVLGAGNSILEVTGYMVNDGNSGNNYDVHLHTAGGTIARAALDISAVTDTKAYDGTTSSSSIPTVSGLQGSDTVTGKSQAFQSKNVLGAGNSILEVTGYTVNDGNSGVNYDVHPHTAGGTITKKNLTVSGITANNKVFDGNTTASLNLGSAALVGVITPDAVTLNTGAAVGTFASSAVGTWTVTVSGLTAGGSDSGNYSLAQPTSSASILPWNANGKGFYAPVGADAAHSIFTTALGITPTVKPNTMDWNSAKGGSTVPLKFNVFAGVIEKTTADAFPGADLATAFNAAKLNICTDTTSEDPIDFTTTGSTTLRYDGTGGHWIQNWKTPNVSGDTCYRAWVTFADGSTLEAFFKLKK